MSCRDLPRVLRLYCNALSSACFSSGHSCVAVGYRCQGSSGVKSGIFEESRMGGWCAGPLNRAPRDARRGPLHLRWSAVCKGWSLQTNETSRSGRARGGYLGDGRRGREVRKRCVWYLCEAFLG